MRRNNKLLQWGSTVFTVSLLIVMICVPKVMAQYWAATPPYNLLWPLWSSTLSPADAVTGLPTPLLSEITNSTILPVQPVLAWDPAQTYPWLLYNVPSVIGGGLTYFDPYYGLNLWPPSYLTDPLTGSPAPITLPSGFSLLLPTDINSFGAFVSLGNLYYISKYPTDVFALSVTSLLTPANIWALPPL
ncbi:MAG: hypothetical protein ACMUJM_17455 [bacterium]